MHSNPVPKKTDKVYQFICLLFGATLTLSKLNDLGGKVGVEKPLTAAQFVNIP